MYIKILIKLRFYNIIIDILVFWIMNKIKEICLLAACPTNLKGTGDLTTISYLRCEDKEIKILPCLRLCMLNMLKSKALSGSIQINIYMGV